jgi:hypothetical protein
MNAQPTRDEVHAFNTARAAAAAAYSTADLATVCAAWVANQKRLDGVSRALFPIEALAVRDVLKDAARRLGIIPSHLDDHIARWRPELLAA